MRDSYTPGQALILAIVALWVTSALAAPAHAADLVEVYKEALQNDPALRSASYQPKIALQNRRRALGATMPQVNSFYQYSYYDLHYPPKPNLGTGQLDPAVDIYYTNESSGLSLDQVLFDFRAFTGFREVRFGQKLADSRLQSTKSQTVLNAIDSYFRQLIAAADQRLAVAELEALAVQLKAAKLRFELGAGSKISVQQIQAQHDGANARAILSANNYLNAQNQLWAVTHQRYEHLAAARDKPPAHLYEPEDVGHWVRLALSDNPDVTASFAQSEQARFRRRRVNANYWPRVNLGYRYGQQAVDGSDRFEATFNEGISQTVSVRVDFPLFTGGGNIAESRIASYEYHATRENEQLVRRLTENQVVQLWNNHKALRAALDAREAALKSSSSSLELVRQGLELGSNSTSDLLGAVSGHYQAERDFVIAIYDYLLNQARFEAAVGILGPETIDRLNSYLQD